jgi:hypothetical protein
MMTVTIEIIRNRLPLHGVDTATVDAVVKEIEALRAGGNR